MIYAAQILLVIINIWMAWYHARLIRRGITPYHGWWGLAYAVVAGVICLLLHSWWMILLSLLIRKVVFDLALNRFRKLKWFYISTSTTSLFDKAHNALYGNRPKVYMAIYTAGIIAINIFKV